MSVLEIGDLTLAVSISQCPVSLSQCPVSVLEIDLTLAVLVSQCPMSLSQCPISVLLTCLLFMDPCFCFSHSGGAAVQAVRSTEGKDSISSRKKEAEETNHR